jgi:hypothetical protein
VTRPVFTARRATAIAAATLASSVASPHSASDAYLTLTAPPAATVASAAGNVVHGQWDVALRDLDFVLKLDDNGDGNIVWGELRKHQEAIAEYAYAHLRFSGDGNACRVVPTRQMVDFHADGAYAALMFDVVCPSAPKRLTLAYQLFFTIDPSHRAILVLHDGDKIATSVLSPDNAKIDLDL